MPAAFPKPWRPSVVAQADAAQRRGEWAGAARLYKAALARNPRRADLWIQLGHCHKELQKWREAYQCYTEANAVEMTAEGCLQLAHVLKLTGNLYAALRAYEASASLGDGTAWPFVYELNAMDEASLAPCETAPEGRETARGGIAASAPSGKLRLALCRCEQDFANVERLRMAGHMLLGRGLRRLARGYFELSFLRDGFSPRACARHMRIALATGLWTHDELPAPRRVPLPHSADQTLRDLLDRLTEEAIDRDDDRAPDVFLREETRLFAVPMPGRAESGIPEVPVSLRASGEPMALVSQVLRALCDPADDPSLAEGLREIAAAVLASPAMASFGADIETDAARTLFNGLQQFLQDNRQPILGAFASGRILGTLWRLEAAEPPDPEDLTGTSASLPRALLRFIEASEAELAVERLVALVGYRLDLDQLADCVAASWERGLIRAAGLLLDRIGGDPGRHPPELLLWACRLLKEKGVWGPALMLVRAAAAHEANADTLHELALLEKTCGNFDRASAALERRLAEDPEDELALIELSTILPETSDMAELVDRIRANPRWRELCEERLLYRLHLYPWEFAEAPPGHPGHSGIASLAPEIAPEFAQSDPPNHEGSSISLLQLGREHHVNRWGTLPILRGIEAVRVRVTSSVPVLAARVRIDGRTISRVPAASQASPQSVSAPPLHRYLFNFWIDFADIAQGLHELELCFEEQSGGYRAQRELVYVDRPLAGRESSGWRAVRVPSAAGRGGSPQERIAAQPSLTLPTRKELLGPIERILVIRADQLGDFVASIPAIKRLRELFPAAHFVGLVGSASVGLAQEIGDFAEVIALDFPYDTARRSRSLPLGEQSALRTRLREFSFDLAIDLCPAPDSRSLLRIAGARFTAGFDPQQFPWLSLGIAVQTSNENGGVDRAPHSTVPLTLAEAIGALAKYRPIVVPPTVADPAIFDATGVEPGGYIVLHTGARHAPQRWPLASYIELARLILHSTAFSVVVFVDSAAETASFEAAAISRQRCFVLAGHRAFAEFDALISHCVLFVGNDSGPKHLAALRGVKVVSIHGGRVPWAEWGQEGDGLIITRQVPCWGCSAEEIEDCGQDLSCLTGIKPEEVLAGIEALLCRAPARPHEAGPAAAPPQEYGDHK